MRLITIYMKNNFQIEHRLSNQSRLIITIDAAHIPCVSLFRRLCVCVCVRRAVTMLLCYAYN